MSRTTEMQKTIDDTLTHPYGLAERAAILQDLRDELRDIKRYGTPDDVASWLAGLIDYYESGEHRAIE